MTGDGGFNEVLFENVEIPDSLRLDAVGKGWTVAMTTLTYERGAAEGAERRRRRALGEPIDALDRAREAHASATACALRDDPITRDAIVQQRDRRRRACARTAPRARPGALRPPDARCRCRAS